MGTLFSVDAHAAGEPCRVVTGGAPFLEGRTVSERRADLRDRHDWLRRTLMREPRGHGGMFGALLVPPERRDSAFGIIFFDPVGYIDGCGHGTLCAVAVWRRLFGPLATPFGVDNPDGSVTRVLEVEGNGDGSSSTLYMPGVQVLDSEFPVPGLPRGAAGLARCGNLYLVLRAEDLGIRDLSNEAPARIRDRATQVRNAAASLLEGAEGFPTGRASGWLEVAVYQERVEEEGAGVPCFSTAVLFSDTQLDRSPCGTGSCALFGVLASRGTVFAADGLTTVGPVGGKFHLAGAGEGPEEGAADATDGGPDSFDFRFRLRGSAHVTGVHEWVLGPADPLLEGFRFEEF
jgi:proline racemase